MKKTHMQYRSGLFIALLILSTLSSCVHTSRGLCMDNRAARQEAQDDNRRSAQEASRPGLIRTAFWSMVRPLAEAEMTVESWIRIGEGLVLIGVVGYCIGYQVGYNIGYTPGYAEGSLDAYLGSGIQK